MSSLPPAIEAFLEGGPFAVVGASNDLEKYGAKVFACYLQNDRQTFPVNPRQDEVQGHQAYKSLSAIPEPVHGVSVITPPAVTEKVVEEAIELGIRHIWMQPGAESPAAVARAEEAGIEVIHGGPCLLVVLHYKE